MTADHLKSEEEAWRDADCETFWSDTQDELAVGCVLALVIVVIGLMIGGA